MHYSPSIVYWSTTQSISYSAGVVGNAGQFTYLAQIGIKNFPGYGDWIASSY